MNLKSIYAALIGVILSASYLINNVANAGAIYDFDIRVNFDGGLTNSQQSIFSDAENLWEFFIVGYRDEFAGPGLDISASGQNIDGVGGTLGQAGIAYGLFLPSYVYATEGTMRIDSADLLSMETAGSLFDIIMHEMAHVIGFGILWSPTLNDLLDSAGNYIGQYGLEAYQLSNPDATFVPVEQDGGQGTAGYHWNEPYGGGLSDLMTGWLDPNTTISLTTINSFADLGYVINPNFSVEQVPEPSTLVIFAFAIMGLFSRKYNKQYRN